MTISDWAGFAVAVSTLIGSLAIAIRFLVKHYLSELKPNSGSSLRDQVEVNSQRLTRVEDRVDQIYQLLLTRRKK
jgi:hypothetical protein